MYKSTRLSRLFLKLAARIADKKPCPRTISYGGSEAASLDCVLVRISLCGDQAEECLVRSSDVNAIHTLVQCNGSFTSDYSIPYHSIGYFSFVSKRFIGNHWIDGKSLYRFVIYEWLGIHYCDVLFTKLRQFLFNLRTFQRARKISVLKFLVEHRIKQRANGRFGVRPGIGLSDLMVELYGARVAEHRTYTAMYEQLKMVIDSLIATEDVIVIDDRILAEGRALETIAVFEEDNRRHRDSVFQNWILLALTAVLAITAVVQTISP